jgi:hypothetical protein
MAKYPARALVLSMDDTTIGKVTAGLDDAGSARDLIDASAYGDDWKDYVSSQQDGTQMGVEIAYDPADASHTTLLAAYNDGEPHDFEMEHALSGFHVGFPALVLSATRGGPKDGLLTLKTSLKILNPGVEDIESS